MFTQQGPYGERYAVSRANGLFIHLYLSESPVKNGHRPRSPTRTEGLHAMRCGLVPYVFHLRPYYHYPSAMQPSARYFPPLPG